MLLDCRARFLDQLFEGIFEPSKIYDFFDKFPVVSFPRHDFAPILQKASDQVSKRRLSTVDALFCS